MNSITTCTLSVIAYREAYGLEAHPTTIGLESLSDKKVRAHIAVDIDMTPEGFLAQTWEHSKSGRLYVALGFHFEDTLGDPVVHVVYRELGGKGLYWYRPAFEWVERVEVGDGKQEQRFVQVDLRMALVDAKEMETKRLEAIAKMADDAVRPTLLMVPEEAP